MSENPYLPDDFDQPSQDMPQEVAPAARPGCLTPNGITLAFLILTGLFVVYFVTLLVNPYLPINPFPPRTPLPVYVIATTDPNTPMPSPTVTKVAETPRLNTIVPSATPTLLPPTITPTPTETVIVATPPRLPSPTRVVPTATLVGGATQAPGVAGVYTPPPPVDPAQATRSPFPFTVYGEAVTYIENPNDQGCRWASIAGTAIDLSGEPVAGLAVHVVGEGIDEIRFTGMAPTYGAGGYEIFLNGAPLQGQYVVQLLSQTGAPISDEFAVQTSAACEENVTIVNFVQNHDF
jgi:hypothetical protein